MQWPPQLDILSAMAALVREYITHWPSKMNHLYAMATPDENLHAMPTPDKESLFNGYPR